MSFANNRTTVSKSTSSLNSVLARSAYKSTTKSTTKSIFAGNSAEFDDTGITSEELCECNTQLLQLGKFTKSKIKQTTNKKNQTVLMDKFAVAQLTEKQLVDLMSELERKKSACSQMALIRESLKMGRDTKDFVEKIIMPVINKTRIPLYLTDLEFEKLKGNFIENNTFAISYLYFVCLVVVDSIKANIDDPKERLIIEKIVTEINKLGLGDNFVSSMANEKKLVEESKILAKNIVNVTTTLTDCNTEIAKYQEVLNKYEQKNNKGIK